MTSSTGTSSNAGAARGGYSIRDVSRVDPVRMVAHMNPANSGDERMTSIMILREFIEEEDGVDGLKLCHLADVLDGPRSQEFGITLNAASAEVCNHIMQGAKTRSDILPQPFADKRDEIERRTDSAASGMYVGQLDDMDTLQTCQRILDETDFQSCDVPDDFFEKYEKHKRDNPSMNADDWKRCDRFVESGGFLVGQIGSTAFYLADMERRGFAHYKRLRFDLSRELLVHTPQPRRRPLKDVFSGILRAGRGEQKDVVDNGAEFQGPELPSNTTGTRYVFSSLQLRLNEMNTLHAAAKMLLFDSGTNKAALVGTYRRIDQDRPAGRLPGKCWDRSAVGDHTSSFWTIHPALCYVISDCVNSMWQFLQVLTYNNRICLDVHDDVGGSRQNFQHDRAAHDGAQAGCCSCCHFPIRLMRQIMVPQTQRNVMLLYGNGGQT